MALAVTDLPCTLQKRHYLSTGSFQLPLQAFGDRLAVDIQFKPELRWNERFMPTTRINPKKHRRLKSPALWSPHCSYTRATAATTAAITAPAVAASAPAPLPAAFPTADVAEPPTDPTEEARGMALLAVALVAAAIVPCVLDAPPAPPEPEAPQALGGRFTA